MRVPGVELRGRHERPSEPTPDPAARADPEARHESPKKPACRTSCLNGADCVAVGRRLGRALRVELNLGPLPGQTDGSARPTDQGRDGLTVLPDCPTSHTLIPLSPWLHETILFPSELQATPLTGSRWPPTTGRGFDHDDGEGVCDQQWNESSSFCFLDRWQIVLCSR